jgi:hypothetical protein
MLKKLSILAVLSLFVFQFSSSLLTQAQQTTISVQFAAQQAQTILSGHALFAQYETRFYQTLNLSAIELAQKLQAMPTETVAAQSAQANQALKVSVLPEYKNIDLKREIITNSKTLLLGTVELSRAGSLAGVALPAGKYGLAAMKGSFVIVLINFNTGAVSAFIVLADPIVLSFGFLPLFFPFEVFFQVAFVIPFPFAFPVYYFPPLFVAVAGCPVLGRSMAVSAAIGSGATLITSPSGGQPTLAIKEGGQLGVLIVESLEPEKRPLTFRLLSQDRTGFGYVGPGAAGRVFVPVYDVPFVLVASDDKGHSACLSAFVIFPNQVAGSATSN